MDRRQVLQMGAALATLPITGCGASGPEPKPALATAGPAAPIAVDAKAIGGDHGAATSTAIAAPAPAPAAVPPIVATAATPADAQERSFSRVIGRVGRNHGHALVVSYADVTAGVEKTYDLTGAAGHPHTVTLSVDDLRKLLAGQLLRTKSTTDRGHTHRVVVRCAPPFDPPEWASVCQFTSSGRDEHEIVITAADLATKTAKTYDIQGLAGHTHEVTLSAADFQKLSIGGPVTLHSTRDPDDAHLHTVSIEYHPGS
jgi:hypothetical protein